MARQSRLFIPECPMVLQLQGIGAQPVFNSREAFALFHKQLPQSAQQECVSIHAYCLVPSIVLLLVSSKNALQAGRFVQNLNRRFVPALRHVQPVQTRAVWQPRFNSAVVQPGVRGLKACLFVEQLAVRQASSLDLASYPWSSFAAHAGVLSSGLNEPWLVDLPAYWQLGNTPFERQSRYRQLSEQGLLNAGDLTELAQCLKTGWLWGEDAFCAQMQALANRSVRPASRGRPVTRKER